MTDFNMSLLYTDKVLEHFKDPHNAGEIKEPDAFASEGSPACGDIINLYLKINPENQVIEDIKFQSYGCASNIATASVLTEMVKGKTLEEAQKIKYQDIVEELGGLPEHKIHCSVLVTQTLKKAIEEYLNKN